MRRPEVQHDDVVADPHDHPHVVLDEQHGEVVLVAQLEQQLGELADLRVVQAAGRLVEQAAATAARRARGPARLA
jgi:hypothetical protein